MSELNTLARPYADAVFQQALASNQLASWSEVLRVLAIAASDNLLKSALSNPAYKKSQLMEIFTALLNEIPECKGDFQLSVVHWLNLLVDSHRLVILPQIGALFVELYDQHQGIKKVHLQSARPLSASEVVQIQQSIERRFKTKVTMELQVDRALTGGFKVCIGSLVWNGSIQNSIAQLGDSLRGY